MNPYRGDAYVFQPGCLVRTTADKNWVDMSGATVTNPIIDSPFNRYEIQFPGDQKIGIITSLYYSNDVRINLQRLSIECHLPHCHLLTKGMEIILTKNKLGA